MKMQQTERETILVNDQSDKGLYSKYIKISYNSMSKNKTNNSIKNGQRKCPLTEEWTKKM